MSDISLYAHRIMRVNVVVAKIAVGLQQRNGMRIILVQLERNWSKNGQKWSNKGKIMIKVQGPRLTVSKS